MKLQIHKRTPSRLKPRNQRAQRANKHTSSLWLCELNLWLVKHLLCTLIWAQASLVAQSQDNIWRVKISHFCLKAKWRLYFSLTMLPMHWTLSFVSHSFCSSPKCSEHLVIFSGLPSCTDLPHKSTLLNPWHYLICISLPLCIPRNYQ